MKKLFTLIFFVAFFLISATAQLADGFYRIRNVGSQRYVYVLDNTGSLNITAGTVEAGAMATWSAEGRAFVSDPASIIYVKKVNDTQFDFLSQGTSVHQIITHYVNLYKKGGYYQVYAEQSGIAKYLSEERTSTSMAYGYLGTTQKGDYRLWDAKAVAPTSADNYFGIAPSVVCNGKYYAPFYASFAFKLASSGMKVYYISRVADGHAYYREWTYEIIPASMPVIIECSSAEPADNKVDLVLHTLKAPAENQLKGVYFANPDRANSADSKTAYDASTMRVLGLNAAGDLSFVKKSDSNPVSLVNKKGKALGDFLAANQAYLPCSASEVDELDFVLDANTAIDVLSAAEETAAIYTTTGTLVRKAGESAVGLAPGFYIQGGKVVKY